MTKLEKVLGTVAVVLMVIVVFNAIDIMVLDDLVESITQGIIPLGLMLGV